jgi:hypothetical protein
MVSGYEHEIYPLRNISYGASQPSQLARDTEEITIGRGKRKRIFNEFSLPSDELSSLYSDYKALT